MRAALLQLTSGDEPKSNLVGTLDKVREAAAAGAGDALDQYSLDGDHAGGNFCSALAQRLARHRRFKFSGGCRAARCGERDTA